jgi:hypothetical protein
VTVIFLIAVVQRNGGSIAGNTVTVYKIFIGGTLTVVSRVAQSV